MKTLMTIWLMLLCSIISAQTTNDKDAPKDSIYMTDGSMSLFDPGTPTFKDKLGNYHTLKDTQGSQELFLQERSINQIVRPGRDRQTLTLSGTTLSLDKGGGSVNLSGMFTDTNDIDYINNINLAGSSLNIVGTGNAFTGNIDLSSIDTDTNDIDFINGGHPGRYNSYFHWYWQCIQWRG